MNVRNVVPCVGSVAEDIGFAWRLVLPVADIVIPVLSIFTVTSHDLLEVVVVGIIVEIINDRVANP